MKKTSLLIMIVLLVGALGVVSAEKPDSKNSVVPQGPRVVGETPYNPAQHPQQVGNVESRSGTVIQYDSGNFNAQANVYNFVFGHRFNSNSGAPIAAGGQITQIQFYMYALSDSRVWCSFYGPPVGTTAPVFDADPHDGAVIGMNLFPVGPYNISTIGADFLAGALNFNSASNPTGDGVGLDQGGTHNGQGFHGMMIHSTYTPTGFQMLGNVNPIFRILGTDLPVELMSFDVTD